MPRALTVTAIIAAYNEEDVIGWVLADLVEQGVRVHLLDHGSTDGTVAEAERFLGRGLVKIERLDSTEFSLASIIRRKELLAAELETDWLLNADADEFRESPWPGIGFMDGLREVDRMGFNAVDFSLLNFLPVHDDFQKGDDPRNVFRFCEPGAPFDRLQIRCWKKQPGPLDLVSTAGHEARFPDRRVFPLRFLLRHYPIRGQAHGERKVFQERLPRFAADERARGWHVQYNGLREGASFLREPSSLTLYDPWTTRLGLALRHRDVEALEEELARTREELANAGARLAEALGDLQRARGTVEALGGELAQTRAELARAGARLAESQGDLLRARWSIEALEGELSRSRAELANAGARRAESEGEVQRARWSIESLEGELSRSRAELANAGARRAESEGEVQRARGTIEALEGELSRSREEVSESRRNLAAERDHRKAEVEGLRGELFQRNQQVSDLRQELAALAETSELRLSTLQYRLDAVLTSRIWKWTSPIRALLDPLSRG